MQYTAHNNLGTWVKKTRDKYHYNKLSAERVEKLVALDFDFRRHSEETLVSTETTVHGTADTVAASDQRTVQQQVQLQQRMTGLLNTTVLYSHPPAGSSPI